MWDTYTFLLLWTFSVTCQEIGQPCSNDIGKPTGVCTLYEKCLEARLMVEVLHMKTTNCSINGVVCCPKKSDAKSDIEMTTTTNNSRHGNLINPINTPIEMNFLKALHVGIYRWNGTVCRFDGKYPITCYSQVYPRYTVDPDRDPINCPKLTWPNIMESSLSPHMQVAWEACRNYSLESSLCLSTYSPGRYVRDDCLIGDVITKVADGEPAQITEFPHMAVLDIGDSTQISKKNKDIIWYGGGSLISEYFILTAGHVIYRNDHKKNVEYAMLGATNKTDVKSGVIFQVVRIIAYPDYRLSLKYHDIALLELNRRVIFSEFIRPICLKVTGLQTTPELSIAGWGKVGDSTKDSPILLKGKITEKPLEDCKKEYKTSRFKWNSKYMLCAGAMEISSGEMPDTCQGDSGGPLMSRITDLPCSQVIVGVVSWGPKCGVGKPGIYTNAANVKYLEWIASSVWPQC